MSNQSSNDSNDSGETLPAELMSVYGRSPLLPGEREYKIWNAHGTNFAFAVATWCFLTGGYTAQLVGAVQGIVCLVAGNLIGVFLMTAPLAMGCQRYGVEQIDFCKPAFGQNGARVILIFYLMNMIGWSGLILVMFGNGIVNIVDAMGYATPGWLAGAGVALGLWLTYILTTRGVHLLSMFNSLMTPALIVIVVFMFYMLISEHGWAEIVAAEPLDPFDSPWLNYAVAVELGIASGMSWWGGIGFLARNTKSRRNAIYPEVLQLGFSSGVVMSVALFSGLVLGTDDPTEWMIPLGGIYMGVLALVFVALANITSTSVSLFASGLALRHVPSLNKRSWSTIIMIVSVPLLFFIVWPQELFDLGDVFLAFNGTMYAPIGGILVADYFFIRKQHLNVRMIFEGSPTGDYYYHKGFNWLGLICIVIGQLAYFALYNPFSSEAHSWFRFMPASIAAFVLPTLIYWVGMHVWMSRRGPAVGETKDQPTKLSMPNI